MEPGTFDRALQTLVRKTPFRAFTVELVSGKRFKVDHPEALAYRHGYAIFVAPDGAFTIFDHESVSRFVGRHTKPRDNGNQ